MLFDMIILIVLLTINRKKILTLTLEPTITHAF